MTPTPPLRPKRWHLYFFMAGMIGIMAYALWYGFSPAYDGLIGSIWGGGYVLGMLRWVIANQAACEAEELEQQRQAKELGRRRAQEQARRQGAMALTPIQQHFLHIYALDGTPYPLTDPE